MGRHRVKICGSRHGFCLQGTSSLVEACTMADKREFIPFVQRWKGNKKADQIKDDLATTLILY